MEAEGRDRIWILAHADRLQRGRLTMEAEGEIRPFRPVVFMPASTGPPHDGGGRDLCPSGIVWNFVVASTGPPHDGGGRLRPCCSNSSRCIVLQRGRLTMEAEGMPEEASGAQLGLASTGPPHDGGGRSCSIPVSVQSLRSFNGAASRWRRKGSPSLGGPARTSRASTGPPHDGGGRD